MDRGGDGRGTRPVSVQQNLEADEAVEGQGLGEWAAGTQTRG
jgi:hypothetical protein